MNKVQEILTGALHDLVTRKRKLLPRPFRGVSFAWPLEDACLMHAISKHYKKSNSAAGSDLFAPLMAEILNALPEEHQEAIAKAADDLIVEFVNSNVVEDPVNLTTWQDFLGPGHISRESR
jgi:hypothetical protein